MPHDRKGNALEKGDRVKVPVRPVAIYQVVANPDHPEQYAPQFQATSQNEVRYVDAVVVALHEGEDACNATFELADASQATFNTRLVEKVAGS